MKISHALKTIIVTLLFFAFYLILKQYFSTIKRSLDGLTNHGLSSYMLTYLLIGIPIYIGTYLIQPKINIFNNLGLANGLLQPLWISLAFALPMLLGGLLFFHLKSDISIPNMIAGTIVAGFVEELFFRGFLFGQLFKYTKLGFIPAIFIGALLFASGHMHQSQDTMELFGIFMVTFMGAVLFAWLYVEWEYNLWVPIFMHTFMNLAWYIFEMDDTALGGFLPNLFRWLTIAIAIIFTVYHKKKKNQKLNITKDTLLYKTIS
ncbi:MAG: type II CAAX endopeptidase family protein [Saprospiraceae bacterium]|nr:type II CAAX endopeptidase family protein [Saprospiraceae bacterium]